MATFHDSVDIPVFELNHEQDAWGGRDKAAAVIQYAVRRRLLYPEYNEFDEEFDEEYDWEEDARRQHAWAHQHLCQLIASRKIQSIARMFLAKIKVMKEYGWWLGCSEEHEQDILLDQIMQEQRAQMLAQMLAQMPAQQQAQMLAQQQAHIAALAENVVRSLFPEDLIDEGLNDVRTHFAAIC